MEIVDQRHTHTHAAELLSDGRHRGHSSRGIHCDVHQLRAGSRQFLHLGCGTDSVRRVGIRRRLHADWHVATDVHNMITPAGLRGARIPARQWAYQGWNTIKRCGDFHDQIGCITYRHHANYKTVRGNVTHTIRLWTYFCRPTVALPTASDLTVSVLLKTTLSSGTPVKSHASPSLEIPPVSALPVLSLTSYQDGPEKRTEAEPPPDSVGLTASIGRTAAGPSVLMAAGPPPTAAMAGAGTVPLFERGSVSGGASNTVTTPEAGTTGPTGVSDVGTEATDVSDGVCSIAGITYADAVCSAAGVSFAVDSTFRVIAVYVVNHCFRRSIPTSTPVATITATSTPINRRPPPP